MKNTTQFGRGQQFPEKLPEMGSPEFEKLSRLEQLRIVSEGMRRLNPESFEKSRKVVRRRVNCVFGIIKMKVYVLNKESFDALMIQKGITNDNVESFNKTFFISINDTAGTYWVPYFENKSNVKVLYFDDADEDLIESDGKIKATAFTIAQAKELLEFVECNKDRETCIVHCAAGISRSGAVGLFVNDYFGGDYFEFKKNNPRTHCNQLVLRLLKQAAG